jgi:hypothetical protein
MIKRGQMILTVSESKRIIAKAILQFPMVKKAMSDGIVVIHPSSTTYFILEELGIELPPENKGLWICGHVCSKGLCLSRPMVELMLGNYQAQEGTQYPFDLIFKKGVLQTPGPLIDVLEQMGEDDVYIKAVNAIDPEGKLGILLCVPGGGSIGSVIRNKPKRKYKILACSGIEKMIPTPIKEAGRLCRGLDRATGVKSSMTVLKPDAFLTEIEAFEMLTGCKATPVACGGVDGMEGGYIFVLEGTDAQLDKAWELWREVRGSKLPKLPDFECKDCPFIVCSHSPKYDPNFAESVHQAPLVEQK